MQSERVKKRQNQRGYVHIYTGDGKGKTTAALGVAFRAMGWQMRTYIGQFLKGMDYGELHAAKLVAPYITIEQFGKDTMIRAQDPPDPEDVQLAQKGLERAKEVLHSGVYDIVVLDEINIANRFGLISTEDMLAFIKDKPEHVELIFTGRNAPSEVVQAAHLVSEVLQIKHYYHEGVEARWGLER
ncbi:MAG: cob(I)yrinic acid a,c-diamide adenosyltransferase [Bacillota bacterium]